MYLRTFTTAFTVVTAVMVVTILAISRRFWAYFGLFWTI